MVCKNGDSTKERRKSEAYIGSVGPDKSWYKRDLPQQIPLQGSMLGAKVHVESYIGLC